MRKLIFMCLLALGTMGKMNAQGMPVYDNTNFISLAKQIVFFPLCRMQTETQLQSLLETKKKSFVTKRRCTESNNNNNNSERVQQQQLQTSCIHHRKNRFIYKQCTPRLR